MTGHPIAPVEPHPGAIPTPRLAAAGRGDAYFVPPRDPRYPGVWYLRAPGYESPDGSYTRVRVIALPDDDFVP